MHTQVVVGLREELHSAHSQLSRLQEEADSKVLVRSASHETRSVVKPRRELEVKVGEPPTETRTSGVVCACVCVWVWVGGWVSVCVCVPVWVCDITTTVGYGSF